MRRKILPPAVVLLTLLAGAASAQASRELRGKVFHLGENGQEIVETGVVVTLQATGTSDDTNDQGIFRLPLPPAFGPGATVTLEIDKPGWRIRYPLDGEARVPSSTVKETIEVELLPAGSKLFWTDDRIEKLLEDNAESAKKARAEACDAEKGHDQKSDSGRYIQEWAVRYGFTPQDAQKEIDRWIASVGANQEDVYRLGLAAFAKKQFAEAAGHFGDSAEWHARQLEETRRRREVLAEREGQLRDEVVRDLRMEGDSHDEAGDSAKALVIYQEAHGYTSREETPELWGATLHDIAVAHWRLGVEGTPTESAAHLEQAIQAFRQALLVYTRERLPEDWAMTQNNLGNALRDQAARTEGERGAQLLEQAVQACQKALLVYTREQLPELWAATLNNLGNALRDQAARTEGERGVKLLEQAAQAYQEAFFVYTREQLPQQWATTQNNLGAVLTNQAARIDGERSAQLLEQAVQAYQKALLVCTREQLPQLWAVTQNNLGAAFANQAERTEGERAAQLLEQAVQAFQNALLVYTREQFPQGWAMAQNNLGSALRNQAARTEGERATQLLEQAIQTYQKTLLACTREQLPEQWAMIQNSLGIALSDQAARTEGERGAQLLEQAVQAYEQALLVYTRDQFPEDWAMTQHNLGDSLRDQAARTEGERRIQLLEQAVQAYRKASVVYTYEYSPRRWALARNAEEQALWLSGRYREAADVYSEILLRNSNDSQSLFSLATLVNDKLFDPVRALSIEQEWLARHPDDLMVRILQIEALFASGAFAECRTKVAALKDASGLATFHRMPILGYEIAAGMAIGSPNSASELATLTGEVGAQPSNFRINWNFPGALHSLQGRPELLHRDWLVRFFQALDAPDRDSILQALRALKVELTTADQS